MVAFEWSEGGRRAAAGWLPIRGHASLASGRRHGAAVQAGQRVKPEARGRRGRRLMGGPGASGKRKNGDSTSKFKNLYFPTFKNCQKFTGARLNYQEHSAITKT
jgi:hypothetical protein